MLWATESAAEFEIADSWEISRVPADCPVGFSLLTTSTLQYVAYYDADRRMTVASRALDSDDWQRKVLPSKFGWDSHNYITMAVDSAGHLHVSGNMHTSELLYFRTEVPGDISTIKAQVMTGKKENRSTYPIFLKDAEGKLLYNYRHGGSGNGIRIWNQYDVGEQKWSRLLDVPLMDGEGKRNAYPSRPRLGPDGYFHVIWVWRDTPDCATNHHLSHVRSKDMRHWESAFGESVKLPIVMSQKSLWVDSTPSGGGMINGGQRLFFDGQGRPAITYHKSDTTGNMQIYLAKPGKKSWSTQRLTEWDEPIPFSGRGSMGGIGIAVGQVRQVQAGVLMIPYHHRDYGSGRIFLDENSLKKIDDDVVGDIEVPPYPREMARVQSKFPGVGIKRASDLGSSQNPKVRYVLQWEALRANRDKPRTGPLPNPSMLKLYKLVAKDDEK